VGEGRGYQSPVDHAASLGEPGDPGRRLKGTFVRPATGQAETLTRQFTCSAGWSLVAPGVFEVDALGNETIVAFVVL